MNHKFTEMSMVSFQRYYEECFHGSVHYCNANDRQVTGFPGNRSKFWQYDSPSVEISLKVEYMAFSHNPNRILVGNSGGVVTFNRVERILIDHNGVCGELVYIFCKGSDTVHCILLDRH